MEKSLTLSVLCVGFVLLDTVNSFPIDISSVGEGGSNPLWLTNYFLTGFGFFLIIISIIFGCVCCRNGKGFKEFRNSSTNLDVPRPDGFVNPTLNSELTIFPPLGANANEICRFEPLPDIKCQAPNLRPAAFSYTEQEISSQDWFFDPYNNFPRSQLKYVQEYGRGWFGRVVEGEAQNITTEEKVTKVMVKILHEDATPTDHMYFLHEVKFYRDLKHPNILQLLGRCLETEPFLVILECYPNGDLKTFLSQNLPSAQALVEQGVTLQMCSNITSGLQFMHDNKFIHTDLAARNCLVGPDLSVKIGDYGNSIEVFKSDYYCAGSVALPVRWCAPETLKCTDITIETREVTPPANIWSLGVVFWEICEFCKLPYAELNDDQVIVRVLGEKNYILDKPNMICLFKDEMYHLMKLCWKSPLQRPTASQIYVVLHNLMSSSKMSQKEVPIGSKRFSQDFEQRWQNLKPNSIPKRDNAIKADLSPSVECSNISSKLKNAKVADSSYVDSPLGIFMSTKGTGQESPRLCLKYDKKSVAKVEKDLLQEGATGVVGQIIDEKADFALGEVVPEESVNKVEFDYSAKPKINLPEKIKGTEQEVDSWLKGVEINNEEDESFVRKISEAIRDLDATLAMEKTSSSEENSGKSTRQNSPGKDIKETNEPVVDFKLGNDTSSFINFTQKSFEITSLQNTEQPQSLNFTVSFNGKKNDNYGPDSLIMPFVEDSVNKCRGDILDESLKESDSMLCGQSRNSSDTDDEIWRRRIEKGEISEKVKEKSKSIANLMILTHIDSDDSDIDFDKPFEKGLNRSSFIRRSGSFAKSSLSSNNFGSENDLTFAVLEDDFKESLKKLTNDHKEHGHFDSLGLILPSSANRENVWESLFKPSDPFSDYSNQATLSETDVNKTVKDSELEMEKFPETNLPQEKSEQNTQNGNNFLGNVASEKHKNMSRGDPIVGESEDKASGVASVAQLKKDDHIESFENEFFMEEKPKCDVDLFNTNCNDSLRNSSHLKEGEERVNIEFNNNSREDSLLQVANESCSSEGNEVEDKDDEETNFLKRNQVFLSSEGFPSFEKVKSSENETVYLNLNETLKKPEEMLGDKQRALEPERKPFKGVLNDILLIPQITVAKEPEEDVIEYENENFEFSKPSSRALRFVLKYDEDAPSTEQLNPEQTNNLEPVSSSIADEYIGKNSKNDFDTYMFGEGASVIVGACEDFTMDYFKGLKTTSEDVNIKNENVDQDIGKFQNDEENLDIWDKHLENAFTQQLNATNFDDISFRTFGLDVSEDQEKNQISLKAFPVKSIMDFIESEKLHTEKLEEPIQINRLTNLSVMSNDEEYEHFKLRTPDDERSSDSGFRDKGSLSESVEDACEGKYNLEDIEAELEEAFVKGVFGNCESDKDKDSANNLKNCNNFEYEESKFYEEGTKNEEDFSDIDGEIEFWHNKDESDYYPEISEFHPTFSQGWYLHPPDENVFNFNRNINEDVVNALRNELRESLPVQSRSFDEFNNFYETEKEAGKGDLNIHYGSDFAFPLSPILEEQDSSSVTVQKNLKNSLLDGSNTNKVRKNIIKLMESVKAVDTNTFMQYLDYMVENEGKDLDEIDETEADVDDDKEFLTWPLISRKEEFEENTHNTSAVDVGCVGGKTNSDSPDHLETNNGRVEEMEAKDDILRVNVKTNEATLVEGSGIESYLPCVDGKDKDDGLEVITDNSENEGLVFTPQMLSPDRERSLSETSRSSNGTRTGDALSEITLSSPDLVPDCFSTSVHEGNDSIREPIGSKNKLCTFENALIIPDFVRGSPELCDLTKLQSRNHSFLINEKNHISDALEKGLHTVCKKLEPSKINKTITDFGSTEETSDMYEMSTSFMGEEDEDEESFPKFYKSEQNQVLEDQAKTNKDLAPEDSDTADWQSESSEDEEMSSSSGEFIWKDGDKEAKIKAACASDFITENSLYEKSENEKSAVETGTNESTSTKGNIDERETLDDEDDDNESSTGSSASITDFVPSAWNSQAIPNRSVLRSPDKKVDKQKKNVWFKKQKYHCVYEYPREPSDNEDAEGSPYKQSGFEQSISETPLKHFNYGVNTVELPNQHFPYGISKVIDFSAYTDWDVVEGEDPDLSLTDTDSENGTVKTESKKSEVNFYNLSPFDYDFNTADLHEGENEFFVSSSSRPFQVSSSAQFLPGNNQSVFNNANSAESKSIKSETCNSKDFVTPDSGIEDSTSVTPSEKMMNLTPDDVLLEVKNLAYPKTEIVNILNDLNYNFELDVKENEDKDIDLEPFGENKKSRNGFSYSESASIPLSNIGLGDLRHAKGRLKLDLPRNHNAELGAIINKKNQ